MAYGKTVRAIQPTPLKFFGGGSNEPTDAEKEEVKAKQEFESQLQAYKDTDIVNPYANVSNTFRDIQSTAGLLSVNTQQAEFEQQQATANQAQMLNQLRGAAGSSGVASLAQAMANQQALNTQRIAASIGAQESSISQQRAQMDMAAQTQRAQGAMQAQIARAQGAAQQQQLQMGQQESLLNIAAEQYGAASQGVAAEEAQQAAMGGSMGSVIGSIGGAVIGSVVPGLGTAVGAQLGGALGGAVGSGF